MVATPHDAASGGGVGQNEVLVASLARLITRGSRCCLLALVFLFLLLGNLPRFVPLPGFAHNQNIMELLLLLAGVGTALCNPRIAKLFLVRWFPVWMIILGSCVYGSLINGFAMGPALFAVRLVLLCLAGFAAGYALKARFGANIEPVLKFGVSAFTLVAVIGLVQYRFFPDCWALWQQLGQVGITFLGDPHQGRLVSTYFDPNFYSTIACFYLLAAFVLWQSSGSLLRAGIVWLIAATILLSGSRTGIATLAATVLATAWLYRRPILRAMRTLVVTRRAAYYGLLTLAAAVLGAPLYLRSVIYMWSRLMVMGNDPSAQARVKSFVFGLELLEEHPFLGMGYNYHSIPMLAFNGLTSLDSSLLVTLVSFGLIFTAVLFLLLAGWAARTRAKLVAWEAYDTRPRLFFDLYLWHLAIVILFSSQTNNVLYFPLWLLPTLMFGSYLSLLPWPPGSEAPRAKARPGLSGEQTP